MILIYNNKIIEIASSSDIDEVLKNHEFKFKDIPFVEVKKQNKFFYKCVTGYINVDTKEKLEVDIMFNHVKITKIDLEAHKLDNLDIGPGYFGVEYRYSIYTTIYNTDHEKTPWLRPYKHIFKATDRRIYKNDNIISRNNNPITLLFSDIIPELNSIIDRNIPASKISFDYWDVKINDDGFTFSNQVSLNFDDVLDMIYGVELKVGNDYQSAYLSFVGKSKILKNLYLENLLGSIVHSSITSVKYDNCAHYWIETKELPLYLYYDPISLRRYILQTLYIGVFLNYNQEKIDEGFKYLMPIDICNEIIIDKDIRNILNFVLEIKATCFEDGQYRVGRDDFGWYEYTILFPTEYNYMPSAFLVNIINETLNINLEYREKDFCYYCRYTTEEQYISGIARRSDFGSKDLQRKYLHKLLKVIIPLLKTDDGKNKLIGKS